MKAAMFNIDLKQTHLAVSVVSISVIEAFVRTSIESSHYPSQKKPKYVQAFRGMEMIMNSHLLLQHITNFHCKYVCKCK